MTKKEFWEEHKSGIKALLVHALPAIIVWGGLSFPLDRASLALLVTSEITAIFDLVKEW